MFICEAVWIKAVVSAACCWAHRFLEDTVDWAWYTKAWCELKDISVDSAHKKMELSDLQYISNWG